MICENDKEWFTAKELVGLPGLPKNATNISRKASIENWQKRQVRGVKGVAYEYHITSLPASVLSVLQKAEPEATTSAEDSGLDCFVDKRLIAGLGLLTREEQALALEVLRTKGIFGLMPVLSDQNSIAEALGFSSNILSTARVLSALPDDEIREILARYENDKQNGLVAPEQEPQGKGKKAS